MDKKLVDKKMGIVLFGLCWIVYFTSYIGRLNYSSVMSVIINDKILTFSQAGAISMVYFFTYGIGQLINGILGDKIKPQHMIFIGLFCSGLANFIMGTLTSFPVMILAWGINGYTQAMIWPPIIRIFAEKYTIEKKMKYSVDIASSMAVGTLFSYFLSACIMKITVWQGAFFLAAGLLIIVSVIWIVGYKRVELFQKKNPGEDEEKCLSKVTSEKKKISLKMLFLGSGLCGILLPVMIHGIMKDGVVQWVPTYIFERFDTTASFSVIVTMVLPLINLTGAYMARYVNRKNRNREIGSSAIFFGVAVIALVLLFLIGKYNIFLTVLLFAVITASMMAINTLYVNLIPLHFEERGRVATVSGFLNSIAYMGSAISTFSIGVVVEKSGWNMAIISWIGIVAAAFLIAVIKKNKKYTINEEEKKKI